MARAEIDFLDEKDKIIPKQRRRFFPIGKKITYLLVFFLVIIIAFGIEVFSSGENLSRKLGNVSLLSQIRYLLSSGDKKLAGESQDRINILLLGIGGAGHDGPNLTDTMMIASIKPSTKQIALISIPRDLLVPIPGYGFRKVNNANAFGEVKNQGSGGELASEVVSQVTDIPIHYYIRIDFAGFVKIIDDLGGITVNVENVLDDQYYPIKGKENATSSDRYEHLYVPVGQQKMDGELALKYVRSRLAKGVEGSDFARSIRQQKVLLATKDKALAFSTLINPYKISRLMDTLSQHLTTNLKVGELLRLFSLVKDAQKQNIINQSFTDAPDNYLYDATGEDGAFILLPKAGDFSEIQDVVKNIFEPEAKNRLTPIRVEIQNGTNITGLASQTASYLKNNKYSVIRITNAPTRDYQKTVIYVLRKQTDVGENAKKIAELLTAQVADAVPNWATATSTDLVSAHADILVILGQDMNGRSF